LHWSLSIIRIIYFEHLSNTSYTTNQACLKHDTQIGQTQETPTTWSMNLDPFHNMHMKFKFIKTLSHICDYQFEQIVVRFQGGDKVVFGHFDNASHVNSIGLLTICESCFWLRHLVANCLETATKTL
jgi:hypothetical protein